MNRIYIKNNITAALIVVVLFVSVIWSLFIFINTDFKIYDNKIRMLVAEQLDKIEAGDYKGGKYPYIVFDLAGKVLYSDSFLNFRVGQTLNVQEYLQTDKSFKVSYEGLLKKSFIIKEQGIVSGFAVFIIPETDLLDQSVSSKAFKIFLPIILGILISAVIVITRAVYCNIRIIKPLIEISSSAKAIISGNYDLEVIRSYDTKVAENEIGDLTYSFELMRDELKQKQIREEKLKKSQQELISCISHDLKTPISTIKAYSEGLRDGLARTTESRNDYVNIIINKTNLLTAMISELLEFSNAQLNQLSIVRKEIYLYEYFKGVVKELEIFVKQNGVEFSYDIRTADMIINIDTKRITEVLYNLVDNSIKYIGDRQGRIEIIAERESGCALIRVCDNGMGISPDDIPYVFDKFYRAEKSRSSSIPGSGLGLSICKHIINEHGGDIYCKSRHNQGCEIGFTISSTV